VNYTSLDGFNTCWWAETDEERVDFYKTVSDLDLIRIVEYGGFLEDVPVAVSELNSRNYPNVVGLVRAIVEEKKGDEFLQNWAREFLYDIDYALAI